MKNILSIDVGTASSKALIINELGKVVASSKEKNTFYYPNHGWVEQNPIEIWKSVLKATNKLLFNSGIRHEDIKAIGIANQRETVIVWDKKTSLPLWNAILWNDRRDYTNLCDEFSREQSEKVLQKTGLHLKSGFSAIKLLWILNNVDGARERAQTGELCFGTINTWLLWNMTGGKIFATDHTNASHTMLFNIHTLSWDDELLNMFNIPKCLLPNIVSSGEFYGETDLDILDSKKPITSMIGDQQSSLFGQCCFQTGDVKCTFGSGSFIMMNTGDNPIVSKHGLLTTIAWKIDKNPVQYALEGLVYSTGSVVDWLKSSLGIIKSTSEIEGLAYSVPDSNGIYFVPAMSGLGSPHWNLSVEGSILGLTPGCNIGHVARAAIEGIVFQLTDVLTAMQKDSHMKITSVKCGGGMSDDSFLMQLQADVFEVDILSSESKEASGMGAAFIAGLVAGVWKDIDEISSLWKFERKFSPSLKKQDVNMMKKNWKHALKSAKLWAEKKVS